MKIALVIPIFLVLGLLVFFPRLVIKLKCRLFGWNVNWQEAGIMHKTYCFSIFFIKPASEIQPFENISVEQLCNFQLASESLSELKNSIKKLKINLIEYDIEVLLTILLARKNIDELIANIGSDRKLDWANL